MLKKEANIIVGGLSAPGKMPCPINQPAGRRMCDWRQAGQSTGHHVSWLLRPKRYDTILNILR